jgi:hypothetical protein
MGVPLGTALQIFSNPTDLLIQIGQHKKTNQYGVGIFRGPGHRYMPLLTQDNFPFKEYDDAVACAKTTLEAIRDGAKKEFENKDSLTAAVFNPGGEKVDKSKVLNDKVISWIIERLKKKKEADTSKMPKDKIRV